MSRYMVVNLREHDYDVYIGRGRDPRTGRFPAISWGNPFRLDIDGDRAEVIRKYRAWLEAKPALVALVKRELRGKVLGCWCAPYACHGDVLSEIANASEASPTAANFVPRIAESV